LKQQFEEVVESCLQSENAFCTAICPFQMDTRGFMEKMQRGAFSAAFKTYRNAVGFPRIVSALCDQRCRTVCPREQTDGALQMTLLEKAAISFAGSTVPNRYVMPKKNGRVAIVGAGPSGLACALRLASRNYDVTIYEKTGRIGGHLWNALDPELFLPDIEEQFMFETVTRLLDSPVGSISQLSGFDAVYVATGAGGESFGLKPDPGGAYASDKPGVFLGGSFSGADSASSIADGLHAVLAIERYLKTGAMNHPRENRTTRMVLDSSAQMLMQPVIPSDNHDFTREEAKAEAARCLRCACDACIRRCDLMDYYKRFPKRICDEVAITIDPASLDGEETFAKKLMATCNQCGACADACPQDIDMGAFLLESRRAMHRKGKLPWAFHDFWLKDMRHAMSDKAALARAPNGTAASLAFFPGCQLGASDPGYVLESYRYLQSVISGTALWLSCCGAPAVWSGDEGLSDECRLTLRGQWEQLGKPAPVFACPACKQMFERFLPEAGGVFLFDLMRREQFVPRRDLREGAYCVFDPCTSRKEPDLHEAVRALAARAGAKLSPLPDEGAKAKCCGWGGHTSIANPEYTKQVVAKRIGQNEAPYIAYCVNCRDIFASSGKETVHLLDVLFDLNAVGRPSPGCNERRKNRAELRRRALKEFWEEEAEPMSDEKEGIALQMDEALYRKLADNLILEEDVREAIARCETGGRTIRDESGGNLSGYAAVGRITCWVEYQRLAEGGYRLVNAYSHRMSVDLEETWHGRKTKTDL